jgi:hypothetical protein
MRGKTWFVGAIILCAWVGSSSIAPAAQQPVAEIGISPGTLTFNPQVNGTAMVLTVSGPDGYAFSKTFAKGVTPSFAVLAGDGPLADGSYHWELKAMPVLDAEARKLIVAARELGDESLIDEARDKGLLPATPLVQSGWVTVIDGAFAVPGATEEKVAKDIVHNDDVIIDGSLCVGNDCYSGLAFGFDTIVLMENNLRIFFDDTSTIQNYPRNDWRIICNDSTDGGGRYFAIEDATEVSNILMLEAGAPDHSLYVDSYGDVGINTSTPYYELHIVDGDSPCVRLDQDGSYGWTPQKWDLCGNESNFFIRDATHASKLPFRIEPDAPTDSIFIKSNGNVGMGTGSPSTQLELEDTAPVILTLHNTLGADWRFNSANNGTFRFFDEGDSDIEFVLQQDGDLTITGSLTASGSTFPDYVFKPGYDLMPLSDLATFIAENQHLPDVPTAGDVNGGKSINMTELQVKLLEKVEELTLYLLDHQETIKSQAAMIESQEQAISELRNRLATLEDTE